MLACHHRAPSGPHYRVAVCSRSNNAISVHSNNSAFLHCGCDGQEGTERVDGWRSCSLMLSIEAASLRFACRIEHASPMQQRPSHTRDNLCTALVYCTTLLYIVLCARLSPLSEAKRETETSQQKTAPDRGRARKKQAKERRMHNKIVERRTAAIPC